MLIGNCAACPRIYPYFYDNPLAIREAIADLRQGQNRRVLEVRLDENRRNPIEAIRSSGWKEGDVACLLDLKRAFPEALSYLDTQREILAAMKACLVCFVTPDEHRRLIESAPNFYRYRRTVLDFTMVKAPAKRDVPVAFISSTFEDLQPSRAAARDAAVGADFLPRMMEYFVADGSKPPLRECLAKVSETDVLVVIVAHRYGWIPPDQPDGGSKSITWLECERAHDEGKEILAFFIDENHALPEEYREEYEITKAIREQKATPALLESVQHNVARLKEFKSWLNGLGIRKTFTTPEDLRGKVSDALREWRERQRQRFGYGAVMPEPSRDPGEYLKDLYERTRYIDIRGLQVGSGKAYRFAIENLYISLTTSIDSETGDGVSKSGKSGKQAALQFSEPSLMGRNAVPLQTALSRSPLVIIGDPGSGKTTFLNYIVCALCQTLLNETPNAAESRLSIREPRLPILVRLADLVDYMNGCRESKSASRPILPDAAEWLPHYLAAVCKDKGFGLDEEYFLRKLQNGECIVLIDGLDEAPVRIAHQSVSRLIESFAQAYSKCGIVVTSRPAAYAEEVLLPGFTHAWIDPLDRQGIKLFLSRWCEALYPSDSSGAAAHCAELIHAAEIRPDIRVMVRNPVMLTALAVIYWHEKRLPEQRADLYDSILRWLARSRKTELGRQPSDRCLSIFAELALAMHVHSEGRKVQVSRRWGAEAIAGEFEPGAGMPDAVARQTVERAERFLADEEVDSGIIVGRGNEVRFWHLTFQEYLAAKAIGGRGEQEQARILFGPPKRIYLPEWREVIGLLSHVFHRRESTKWTD